MNESTPLDPSVLKCPHAFNARMRQEAPIYQCPDTDIFFVFDYATIHAIAGNPDVFSNRFGRAMRSEGDVDPRLIEAQKEGYPAVDTMLTEIRRCIAAIEASSIRRSPRGAWPRWDPRSRRSRPI